MIYFQYEFKEALKNKNTALIIEFLKNTNINKRDNNGFDILYYAINDNNLYLIKILVSLNIKLTSIRNYKRVKYFAYDNDILRVKLKKLGVKRFKIWLELLDKLPIEFNIKIPKLNLVFPSTTPSSNIGVQSLSSPTNSTFSLKVKYGNNSNSI